MTVVVARHGGRLDLLAGRERGIGRRDRDVVDAVEARVRARVRGRELPLGRITGYDGEGLQSGDVLEA